LNIHFNSRQILTAATANELSEIYEDAKNAEVIGIDEGQFVSILK
jgi:hypothetical protein